MYYLSVETSCDETSLTLLRPRAYTGEFVAYLNSFEVVASVVSSQIDVHREFGGVVPEIGAREHAQYIHLLFKLLLTKIGQGTQETVAGAQVPVVDLDLREYRTVLESIQKIFVTTSPGLVSALRVGLAFAESVQYHLPHAPEIVEVNHLHGHMVSCFYEAADSMILPDVEVFPHLHLLVSGGNSQIILMETPSRWRIIGATLDDAAGESFDKAGRLLGLPYPAGVSISRIAGTTAENIHDLPRGMLKNANYNYSFSGLKTAVRYYVEKQEWNLATKLGSDDIAYLIATPPEQISNERLRFVKEMCISLQFVIVEQLTRKFQTAIAKHRPRSVGLSGGVSANPLLRQELQKLHSRVYIPPLYLTGDNATMIGLSGLSYLYSKPKNAKNLPT